MIAKNDKKVTVDFVWSSAFGNKKEVKFDIKHHHTDEYGPTISVSENKDERYAFPVVMFIEVVDFLRSEGIIESQDVVKKEVIVIQEQGTLSIPVIKNIDNGETETVSKDISPVIEVKGDPIETFSGSDKSQDVAQSSKDGPGEPKMDKSPSDAFAKDTALERENATKKAKKKPGFSVSHKQKEE